MLAAINWLNAFCCVAVIALTAWKRRRATGVGNVAANAPISTALMIDNVC
jgi:hypothetical protein